MCSIKMMVTIDERKSGLILKLGNCVRWIWTQGWQRPASVLTTGAINEIFPLNIFLEIFPHKLLKNCNFCFSKRFHEKNHQGRSAQGGGELHTCGRVDC